MFKLSFLLTCTKAVTGWTKDWQTPVKLPQVSRLVGNRSGMKKRTRRGSTLCEKQMKSKKCWMSVTSDPAGDQTLWVLLTWMILFRLNRTEHRLHRNRRCLSSLAAQKTFVHLSSVATGRDASRSPLDHGRSAVRSLQAASWRCTYHLPGGRQRSRKRLWPAEDRLHLLDHGLPAHTFPLTRAPQEESHQRWVSLKYFY